MGVMAVIVMCAGAGAGGVRPSGRDAGSMINGRARGKTK